MDWRAGRGFLGRLCSVSATRLLLPWPDRRLSYAGGRRSLWAAMRHASVVVLAQVPSERHGG